jgi:glycerol-3-phosphate acyltransferase PlsY
VPIVSYGLTFFAAYLLGSIPTGYLVGRAKGVDIRTVGSRNMGATNVFRTVGKTLGILVLLADAAKGWLAVAWLAPLIGRSFPTEAVAGWLPIVAGIGAILGHNYTCWLQFKGGKGIATSAGVFLALAPWALLIALVCWIILFAATRYVSVASIAAAAVLPVATWFTTHNVKLTAVAGILGAMAILKHKKNIERLRAGTENRIEFGKKEGATP